MRLFVNLLSQYVRPFAVAIVIISRTHRGRSPNMRFCVWRREIVLLESHFPSHAPTSPPPRALAPRAAPAAPASVVRLSQADAESGGDRALALEHVRRAKDGHNPAPR